MKDVINNFFSNEITAKTKQTIFLLSSLTLVAGIKVLGESV